MENTCKEKNVDSQIGNSEVLLKFISKCEICGHETSHIIDSRNVLVNINNMYSELANNANNTVTENGDNVLANIVSKILYDIGVPPHCSGFDFLESAIKIIIDNKIKNESIAKIPYNEVAKIYGVTRTAVERDIRYAIDKVFDQENVNKNQALAKYFSLWFSRSINNNGYRPMNSEFMQVVARFILNLRKEGIAI
ncbi:MAG: sporulation initiation factor Spo0A C-terminal domain-containing protein [Candidatus Parvarchaeum sp.]